MRSKKKSPAKQGNSIHNLNNITLTAQRARLLEWLKVKPMTTIEVRHQLNILAPAARIFELRHTYNLNIVTHWEQGITPEGKKHRVAKYILMSSNYKGQGVGHV